MFYSNLKLSDINDDQTFWKTMKPLLSDNFSQSSRIALVEKDRIISDDHELAKIFVTIVKNAHCVKSVRIRIFSGPYFPAF